VEAFAIGVESLKQVNQKHSAEEVGEIMDELGNVLADQAELDKAISANVADSHFEFDDAALETELEALVAEDVAEKREKNAEEAKAREKKEEEAREREREEKRKEMAKEIVFDEAELEKDLEKLEREEGEKHRVGDSSVDALSDLVGGVSLGGKKEKNKPEAPMLA
jgi:hypothetical protein